MSTTPALRGAALEQQQQQQQQEGPGAGGRSRNRNRVVVSGFGPFRGISDNPSQRLVEALQAGAQTQGSSPIVSCRVIEVSAVGAEEAVEALHCEADGGGGGSGGDRVVFLHMGVDSGATEFKLECRAMNEADFRCPDERQHQPRQAPILTHHDEGLAHAYYSHLDLASLARELRAEGWAVTLSHNAGRFVCNWTYYHSLSRCRTRAPNGERACVFLHVPPFAAIPFERQLAFVRALIARLAAMEPHAQHGEALRALAPPPGSARSSDDEAEAEAEAEGASVFVNDATFLPPPAPAPAPVPPASASNPFAAAVSSFLAAQQPPQPRQQAAPAPRDEAAAAGVMDLGFSREQAEQALGAVAAAGGPPPGQGATEAAITWLCETDGGANPVAASLQPAAPTRAGMAMMMGGQQQPQRFKMVLVVRMDLGMSPGKIAAQCVHAALGIYQAVAEGGGAMGAALVNSWQAQGEPVIALKCDDVPTLRALESKASSLGLPTHVVRDAGRTEIEPGSVTVLAVGPAPAQAIDVVTGGLRLL